jgi:hypothetical protein
VFLGVKLFVSLSQSCLSRVELTDVRGGKGMGEEPNPTARMPGPL